MPKPKKQETVSGEHIFPASQITPLAVKWKELNAHGQHEQAMLVLEDIVKLSTAMFERLAQHEDFHHTVDLNILVSAAQEKVIKWLLRWNPKKGRIFSWFSKCAKHAFLSELVKVNQYRKRFHVTGDNLEKYFGADDHTSDRHNLAEEFNNRLKTLYCYWGSLQERGAIRYLVECIVDLDNHDKQSAIRGAAYAYGIDIGLAKFFYTFVLVSLRDLHYDKIRVSLSESDLMRMRHAYDMFMFLMEEFPIEKIKRFIAVYGGQRFKVPTMQQVQKLREDYRVFEEIERGDKDPDSLAEVARKFKKTPRTASEIYHEMAETMNPQRVGEYGVFSDDPYE